DVIVERDAGGDHVDQGEAVELKGGLQDRHEASLVPGKSAGDERRPQGERQEHGVDRLLSVLFAALAPRTEVGRCRELPVGKPIDAVVLDQVEHPNVAANRMAEVTETNR